MATIKVRWGGVLVTPSGIFVKQNGALVKKAISVRSGGALVSAYSPSTVLSVSPNPANGYGLRGRTVSVYLSAVGGTGSYSWAWISGGTGLSLSATTGAGISVSGSTTAGAATITRSGTLRCTSGSSYVDIPVAIQFDGTA